MRFIICLLNIFTFCNIHSLFQIGMALFLKNVSFHGILVDSLFNDKNSSIKRKQEVVELVNQGIADGTVQPLNTILFNHDQVEQAFRYMASGRHIGKVVIKVRTNFLYPFKIFCVVSLQTSFCFSLIIIASLECSLFFMS